MLPCLAPLAIALAFNVAKDRGIAKEEEHRGCDVANAPTSKTHSDTIVQCGRLAPTVARRERARRGHTPPQCTCFATVAALATIKELVAVFNSDAVRHPCPGEQPPVAGASLQFTECISAATSATTSGDEIDNARAMLAQSHGVATTCLTLAFA